MALLGAILCKHLGLRQDLALEVRERIWALEVENSDRVLNSLRLIYLLRRLVHE